MWLAASSSVYADSATYFYPELALDGLSGINLNFAHSKVENTNWIEVSACGLARRSMCSVGILGECLLGRVSHNLLQRCTSYFYLFQPGYIKYHLPSFSTIMATTNIDFYGWTPGESKITTRLPRMLRICFS